MPWKVDKFGNMVFVLGEGEPATLGEAFEQGPQSLETALRSSDPGSFQEQLRTEQAVPRESVSNIGGKAIWEGGKANIRNLLSLIPESSAVGKMLPKRPPAMDAGGIAAGMPPLTGGARTAGIPFKAEPGDAATNPYSKEGMADFGTSLSSILDLRRLGQDMEAARAGDPAAKQRVAAAASSPALSSTGKKKAPEMGGPLLSEIKGLDVLPTRDMTGAGLSAATLPGARDLTSKTFDAQPGGGGVEVPEQEQKPNKALGLGIIGDTLINIGNAVGNPRFQTPTGGYLEQVMQQRQQEQMQQLKMRHDLWADAYKQSQELPGEVLTAPEFAGLAQAKAALDKDMADGKIDNEKNVSTFLVEQAKAKVALKDLQLTNLAKDELGVEENKETIRSQREAEWAAKEAAGDPTALARRQLLGPSKQKIYEDTLKEREEQRKFREQQQREMNLYRQDSVAARREAAAAAAAARGDATAAAAAGRRGQFVSSSYENAIRRRLPDQATLSEMDPKQREELVGAAQQAALHEITPRLLAAARAAGLKITTPDQDATLGFSVNGVQLNDPNEFALYLLGELGG